MESRFFFLKYPVAGIIIAAAFYFSNRQAQTNEMTKQDLYKEIASMDSLLFNAFNARDIERFNTMFAEDLEFYHDKGGLTNYQHTVDFMKEVSKTGNDLKRDLIKGSLEVYPIPGYGAMETGSHTFCHTENGKQECGTFNFVHIWEKKSGEWKITRVVSYGH
jgi:ketosteroid isomerase-like protein